MMAGDIERKKKPSAVGQAVKGALTNADGEYDAALVVGYGVIWMGALVFYILAGYDTYINDHFNYFGFSVGLAAIGLTVMAAAGASRFKNGVDKKTPGEQMADNLSAIVTAVKEAKDVATNAGMKVPDVNIGDSAATGDSKPTGQGN